MASPIVATYSICACDLEARQWGVAVQSKFLAVGSVVPWAEPLVGAIATQAYANPRYGPDGLVLLRGGLSADETVRSLTDADEDRAQRQLGIVDGEGRAATHTGVDCNEWAGGRTGAGYAAQGNILASAETVDALAETFEATTGKPLVERLLDCLDAAQAVGGDRRGQQSAAILVVGPDQGYAGLSDVFVDLRVDDHERPLEELRRLFGIHEDLFGQTPRSQWIDVDAALRREIVDRLAEDLRGKRVSRDVSLEQGVEAALRDAITKALSVPPLDFFGLIEKSPRPFVVMFVGVNGTGKTTTIAKLAYHIMKKGYTCVVAAADTFRAGAIEQLEKHAEAVGFKLIKHNAGADPAAVAFDAVEHARARGRDVVLIDTAGRMQTNQNLMDQMKKIKRVARPNLILYIGDALAGNDAIEQAKQFHEAVGLDGIVLTKIDADAKGGAALSMAKTIGKPVVFVNLGQTYQDIRRFDTKWMVDRLLAEA